MTTRDAINAKVRGRVLCCILATPASVVCVCFATYLCVEFGVPGVVAVCVGMITGVACIMVARQRGFQKWQCPSCAEPLLSYFVVSGLKSDLLKMPAAFRYCPYCGQSFDEEMETPDLGGTGIADLGVGQTSRP